MQIMLADYEKTNIWVVTTSLRYVLKSQPLNVRQAWYGLLFSVNSHCPDDQGLKQQANFFYGFPEVMDFLFPSKQTFNQPITIFFFFFDMRHDCQLGIHKLHRANNHHKRRKRFDGIYLRFVMQEYVGCRPTSIHFFC